MTGSKPNYLYKYRSWKDDYHKRILSHDEIFFASARGLNDLFECTLYPTYEKFSKKENLANYAKYLKEANPLLSESAVMDNAQAWNEKGLLRDVNSMKAGRNRILEMKYDSFGFFSLSELPNNEVMWSHYSDFHKGFCVGFDVNKLEAEFERLFYKEKLLISRYPAVYVDNFEPFDAKSVNDEEYVVKQLITKNLKWAYEREHRCILIQKTNLPVTVDKGLISQVIFGSKISEKHESEIIEVLRKREFDIHLFKIQSNIDSRELEMRKLSY